jgi:hypothetical protein
MTKEDKEKLHKLFKGYLLTCRNNTAVLMLGYQDAPENMLQYKADAQEKAETICKTNGLQYAIERRTEWGYKRISLRITLTEEAEA